jgi:putative CocE/NonD family hydrolase
MKTGLFSILIMTCSVVCSQDIIVQEEDFIKLIHSQGAEKAIEYFQHFQKSYPDSILFRRKTINNLGWETASKGNLTEAIKLFELNLLAYPEHYDPWDSYAEAVLMRGDISDIDIAIRNFEKSLELNPDNSNAALRLLVLKNYTKHVYMVPMRDGVKLYTQVYMPRDKSKQYPILYKREWYGVQNYGPEYRRRLHPNELFVKEGFIFVYQDIRGRFMSEGNFEVLRPYIENKTSNKDIDESTDAYDTVDWLLENLEGHNGMIGIYGGSYSGWATLMAALEPHPAVKAVLAAASPADWWMGDDLHHNGAFRLMYAYSWVGRDAWPRQDGPNSNQASLPVYTTNDGYQFFLDIGPIKNVNEEYFHYENPTWNEYMKHGDYDNFWKERNLLQHLNKIKIPVLNVAGWFDAEDYRGPLMIYETIEKNDTNKLNSVVIGPWNHGGWNSMDESLGDINFESNASEFYQKEIEFPFFKQYLKNGNKQDLPEAYVFQTGENKWKKLNTWPPTKALDKKIYIEDHGSLTFEPEYPDENQPYDEFLSDPNKPVPWSMSIQTQQGSLWMIADQRFAANRPDVLVYKTKSLEEDITIAGPIIAHLSISSTGTDADWIVKVIDVYPSDAGKLPGDYQMLLAGDVFRSKYRNSFENPEALVPNQITEIEFNLFDKFHTFRKGHRIMVQIQSTWFPVIDRNPQVFCNIYEADKNDFHKAFNRVYHSGKDKSYLIFKIFDQ